MNEGEPGCGSDVWRVTLLELFLSSSLGPPCPAISFLTSKVHCPYRLGNASPASSVCSLRAGTFLAQLIDSLIEATTFTSIAYQGTQTAIRRSLRQDDCPHWPKLFPCYFSLTLSFLMVLILRRTARDS